MPLLGFYILGAGLLLGFCAFLFMLVNMALGVNRHEFSVNSHIGGMAFMAFGGMAALLGVIVAIMQAIQTYG